MCERLKFPTTVTISVHWGFEKYKSYRRKVTSDQHLNKLCDYYESRGGKVIGVHTKSTESQVPTKNL